MQTPAPRGIFESNKKTKAMKKTISNNQNMQKLSTVEVAKLFGGARGPVIDWDRQIKDLTTTF